ncbi:MAG TPA: glycosyltransferase family 39 protein, partial [Chitinophagaceae bacterium]|nr:glycosyltransferase family 39 protein [Chitinophagaceae bacterium]
SFGGSAFAQLISGIAMMTGAYMRMHSLFQPNIFDIFFWSLSILFLVKFVRTRNTNFFYGFAVALSLGVLGKYSAVFLIASLVLGLFLSRHRYIFARSFFYKALLVAILIIAPNIWWQYQHKWPLVHHMQELQQTQLRFLSPTDFIKDQLLYLLPAVFVWIVGLVWLFKQKDWRFLGWTYFFIIILLILGRGRSYYSMGIYPTLLAAGAVALERWTIVIKWLRPALFILMIALTIPFVPTLLAIWRPAKLAAFYQKYKIEKTGLLKWEDQQNHSLPQDFADMLGWKELAEKTERFFNTLPDSIKTSAMIFCRNYGQAGALKFYGRGKVFTRKVFAANGSFILWLPDTVHFKHLILIARKMPDKDDKVFQHFQSMRIVDSVSDVYSRQLGNKIIFYQDVDSTGLIIAATRLKEMKYQFER